MKRTKWTKWQIGAGSALIIALLFSQIKSSDAYKEASALVAGTSASTIQETEQSISGAEDSPSFQGEGFSQGRQQRGGMRSGSQDSGSSRESGSQSSSGRS